MKRICAWCEKDLTKKTDRDSKFGDSVITHGICEDCRFHVIAQLGMQLDEFLDGLPAPVVMVDSGGTVKTANKPARNILHKDMNEIKGYLGGDVFECAYAALPGGCGQTIHCSGCTIRNAVTETYNTGKSLLKIPAYLNRESRDGTDRLDLLISTEKVGEYILLRIDSIEN